MDKALSTIGRREKRVDALSKALGTAKYVADNKRKDMLVGKPLFAGHPHALIKNVDVSKAAVLEGVVAVMTAKDLPGRNSYGAVVPDKPVICDKKTRYQGDVVALVAAIDEKTAEKALALIKVEYEPLPVYDDPRQAVKEDAVPIHDSHPMLDKGNKLVDVVVNKGDADKAFAQADIVIENNYETPTVEHCYFEPDCCIAEPDPLTGGITLHGPQQGITAARRVLGPVFGLAHNKIRVLGTVIGGGFGGREESAFDVCAIAGVLALKTGRTVIVEYSREDIFRATGKRHAAYIRHRLAATKDGKITAIDVETMLTKGAYLALGGGKNPANLVVARTAVTSGGAYNVPNVKVRSYAVFTNGPYGTAFRGFGAPQAHFGIECQMDELARRVGVDPVEIRRRNMLRAGDSLIIGQVLDKGRGVGLEECLQKVTEKIGWDSSFDRGAGHIKRGRGVGILFYGTGAPVPWEGAGCLASLDMDGSLSVNIGVVEMGQGVGTAYAQLAAETLGLRLENVQVNLSDSLFPDAGPCVASRSATIGGNAVVDACRQLKERLLTVAAKMLDEDPANIDIKDRIAYVTHNPEKYEKVETVIFRAYQLQAPLSAFGSYYPKSPGINPETGQGALHEAYSYGAHAIELEVDTETGVITILRSVLAVDVGRAINPEIVEGQMEGGAAMGIGWAIMEETLMNQGIIENTAFHNYMIPTVKDLPDLESIIVEHHNETGPYGAKGVGEPPILAAAPAIRNALWDALGFKINEIPLTARRVLAEIKKNADSSAKGRA